MMRSEAQPQLDKTTIAEQVVTFALDRKALTPIIIDLRDEGAYTDFLIIVSGTSDRHVQAIAEHVGHAMKDIGHPPYGMEGLKDGQWALVDFGDAVLHVFHQFTRDIYRLEELWKDAPRLPVPAAALQGA